MNFRALQALYRLGSMKAKRLLKGSAGRQAADNVEDILESREGRDERREQELVGLFQKFLKDYLRQNILNVQKNAFFTQVVKERDSPLYSKSILVDSFMYVRRLVAGYKVGFNVNLQFNDDLTVGHLLYILENGANLTNGSEEIKSKIRKYMFAKMKEKGIKPIKSSKSPKGVKVQTGDFIIPPRPFFDRIADDFIRKYSDNRTDIVKGTYYIVISVMN